MDPFYVGFAISVYQCSGDEEGSPSNWGHWNDTWKTLFGKTKIAGGQTCGKSNDFWNLYKEDIDRAAEMGSNAFRLSLEWSRLQPNGPGQDFDSKAVGRFHEILDYLIDSKHMEPFLSLHHYVHPQWFEALGGFTKRDNIQYFVDYCIAAYKEFGRKVRFWCTFNEPGVASFAGFIHGSFPPGKHMRFHRYGIHLRNMLIAHTEAYDAIKALPGAESSSIGIVHNWFWFEPAKPSSWCCFTPPYVTFMANLLNRMWGNDILIRYLETGEFDYNPFWGLYGRVRYTNPRGKPGCDHFGLNYYSRGLMDWKLAATKNPGEIMTDMPYALYAEGIFEALKGISVLNIPIYITETGVADKGDAVRPVMIQTYMSAIEQAIRAGYDIRGVLYWSLVDNFEWAFGYTMKFGIYEWDASSSSQQRQCRQSGQLLKHWFKRLLRVQGTIWSPDIFPNPKRDTYLCGRDGRKSNICDPDSVLSTRAADRVEGIIQDVQEGMSPYRQDQCGSKGAQGYQIAVAVMKQMKMEHGMDPKGAAREFAKQLHARWGVGLAECDNGVLVLLSVGDRQVYISTGKQSATVLSTDNLNLIISWMIPYLKDRNYDEAVIRAVTNIGLGLSGWELSKDDPAWSAGLFFFLIIFGLVGFSLISGTIASRKRRKRLETCKDVLNRIKEEQDKVQSKEWSQHRTCPVCLEAFCDDDTIEDGDDEETRQLVGDDCARRRMILQCGHAVCEPCLRTWMEQSRSCPICRKDVDDGDDESKTRGSLAPPSSSTQVQRMGHVLAGDALAADLIYRLRRAQHMYPEYITDDLIHEWNTDTSQTGTFDFARFSDHQVRNEAIAVAQERSGHFGNVTSFGGGGGSGGGGAGGSW